MRLVNRSTLEYFMGRPYNHSDLTRLSDNSQMFNPRRVGVNRGGATRYDRQSIILKEGL